MVFYRKYRAQTLEQLAGQGTVKQALKSAFAGDKLSHAYLFYGPRGTGKTSTARILAKMVNCQALDQQTLNPCNQCSSCTTITDGSNMDVIEMDAASNRGIEDIRNLRDNIKLSPTAAKKKVYIIDEVHMLSGDAFNALLKTLEEPPSHVLFILATTEVQKIPQTILSRVQKLDFKPASITELVEVLNNITKAENINITDEGLLAVAKKANGSFRDGVKLLDQLSGLEKIDLQVVEESLGLGAFDGLVKLLGAIIKKNSQEALEILTEQVNKNINVKEFNLGLLDILRQLLFIKNQAGERLVKPEVGEEKYQLLLNLASEFPLPEVMKVIDLFQNSLEQTRFVSIPTLPLEVAVVESCMGEVQDEKVKQQDLKESKKPEVIVSQTTDFPNPSTLSNPPEPNDDMLKIQSKWGYVLETVKQYNYSLEAMLRSSKIMGVDEKNVVFEVPYSFHQRILEAPKNRELVESILSDVLSRSVRLTTVLGSRPVSREEIANIEVAADDEIVRIAAEIFNSDVVN